MKSKHELLVDTTLPVLTLTLALWVPSLTIFCRCAVFFTFSPLHFLALTGKVAIPFLLVMLLMMAVLRKWRHYGKVVFSMLILVVQVWLQGEVFGCFYMKYSVLDIWQDSDAWIFGGLLMVVSLLVGWWMVRCRRTFYGNRNRILLCVLCWLLFSIVVDAKSYHRSPYDDKCYAIDEAFKYDFARKDNVIVVIVDCMGKEIFKEMARQFPEVTDDYKDFTMFDNMLSDKPKTAMAVPGMFTGVVYPGSVDDFGTERHAQWLKDCFSQPSCIFPKLHMLGYRCECYPLISHIISLSTGAFVNTRFKKRYVNEDYMVWLSWRQRMIPKIFRLFCGAGFHDGKLLISTMDLHVNNPDGLPNDPLFRQRIMNEFHVGDVDKCFKYYHLYGAHEPVVTDENLHVCKSEKTIVQQLRGSFRALEALLLQLKEHGLYDRSMIVITGDHDEQYKPPVMTFIKLPGQRQDAMSVVSETTHLKDVGQTILAACGIEKETDLLFKQPKAESLKLDAE